MRTALALLLAALPALASGAQLYRWTDAQGNVHYSQQPPVNEGKNVEQKRFGDKAPDVRQLPYATQQAVKKYPVTFYTADSCDPCKEGKAYLTKRGVPHSESPVASEEAIKNLKKLTGGQQVVPVLTVGGSVVLKGFEESAWANALDAAGYPKSGPPIQAATQKAPEKAPAPPPPPPPGGAPEGEAPPPAGAPGYQ